MNKQITNLEFEQMVVSLETKPYLIIITDTQTIQLLQEDGVRLLTEFNQLEMLKEVSTIFILDDSSKFNPTLKGFFYPFTINNIGELNQNLFERNRIYDVV